MSDLFDHGRSNRGWISVLPAAAVVAIFLLEIETPNIRVTPSLLTILLAISAIYLSPRAVVWWAVILFVPVVLTMLLIPNNGVHETPVFVALRSTAYLAVGWIAVALSRYRQDSIRKLEGLLSLFDSLKNPIVVSDIDGNIKFANRACCELLGRSAREVTDVNFFSVFTQPEQRGKSIEHYLKMFDLQPDRNATLTVSVPAGPVGRGLEATCTVLQWDSRKFLVTQLG
ncbi:MAG: fold [Verrucomicrobiota bacterium]|jgi:PAS domain-containing protein